MNDITQIAARDDAGHRQVFHHYLPDRRSQTRGVTAFAPMADTADHWDDLRILAVNPDLPPGPDSREAISRRAFS